MSKIKEYLIKVYQNISDFVYLLTDEIIYKLLVFHKPQYKKRYKISICAIFKDEAPYLKEWIEYHLMLGVEHFYFYDNGSTDEYEKVLEQYINDNVVTLIHYPGIKQQMNAYRDFWDNYKNGTQWVIFLDIDEFICPIESNDLQTWLRDYEKYPIVVVYWKMFGTSGLMDHYFDKLVIEQYHICWNKLYHVGKCFFNTDYQIANREESFHHEPKFYCHFLGIKLSLPPVNQFKRVAYHEKYLGCTDREYHPSIQINHYWSKAWNLYNAKRNRPSACRGELKTRLSYFLWHEHQMCSADYNIHRYVMQLKLRLNHID